MASSRTLEIHLDGDEINVDLDDLDDDPEEVYVVLQDSNSPAWMWRTVAAEYWGKGDMERAEHTIRRAIDLFEQQGREGMENWQAMQLIYANFLIAKARHAPKLILWTARHDKLESDAKDKGFYINQAATSMARLDAAVPAPSILQLLSKAVAQLAENAIDAAGRTFDEVLGRQPNNTLALMGKGRIQYARKGYREAVKTFQRALSLSPTMLPDPRVGIGLCAWSLGDHERAKHAWERSLEVHPDLEAPQILICLSLLNDAKDKRRNQKERTRAYGEGIKGLASIFRDKGRHCAIVADALSAFFIDRKEWDKAAKAAERAIQYADLRSVVSDGFMHLGRIAHLRGEMSDAIEQYGAALDRHDKNQLARAGLGQVHILTNEIPAAIHDFELLLSDNQNLLQAILPLASLQASGWQGANPAEQEAGKARARGLFERAARIIKGKEVDTEGVEEPELWVEIAKLWQTEDANKAREAYARAVELARDVTDPEKGVDPKLLNALAVIRHIHGGETGRAEARDLYQEALVVASKGGEDTTHEMVQTVTLYNLARCWETLGEQSQAQEAYEKLLSRHPEYVDAKARLAHVYQQQGRIDEAHALLKDALESQTDNLDLRAYYTYFLASNKQSRPASKFAQLTLSSYDKHDVYSLCAVAADLYSTARENKDSGSEAIKVRRKHFQNCALAYDKVLSLDPTCAYAAMGLAIAIAEDALGGLAGAPVPGVDEAMVRERNAGEALSVFARVRESINTGSVFINMGHCYYTLDQFQKAIESYELASRTYAGKDFHVLLHLARSWYARANVEQSSEGMETALDYAKQALALAPEDKATLYDIAVIQQKFAELLFSLPADRRTLAKLEEAIAQANEAQTTFAALVDDKSPVLPFARDLPDQRRRYGETVLRKSNDHIEAQKAAEAEVLAKAEAARQMREDERRRKQEEEETRIAEIQRQAAELSERRRQAREEAALWNAVVKQEKEEEEEADRKPVRGSRKKRQSAVNGSGANSETDGPLPESKKKKKAKRSKLSQSQAEQSGEDTEDEALFTDTERDAAPAAGAADDDDIKPESTKPRAKRVIREDDEEAEPTSKRRKKIKSKATISDSDEDMSD
ncbi:TPR-like protein [Calocera viscosa TUFC12733]|uniref:TPR-like protein n=1 Tax=Calocera viscosa (strain TUFC12733) TaxID=1330018 RepID=A0A167JPK5_CALVF|nr:TPR-like protein [Calocera viscosa TUFC12733]